MKQYIVIGSSKGLGAALTENLLLKNYEVIGLARTPFTEIKNSGSWSRTGRYKHIQIDITSPECSQTLRKIISGLPKKSIGLIFNAALVMSDVNPDSSINFKVYKEVNQVQIEGLGKVLDALQAHLLLHGGIVVGISSFSALSPPVQESRLAYPASKAYLDMALRCLRNEWGQKVTVVTVHLGHIGEAQNNFFSRKIVPSYKKCAEVIIKSLEKKRIPNEINYPYLYCLIYKYLLRFFPDSWYSALFKMSFKVLKFKK